MWSKSFASKVVPTAVAAVALLLLPVSACKQEGEPDSERGSTFLEDKKPDVTETAVLEQSIYGGEIQETVFDLKLSPSHTLDVELADPIVTLQASQGLLLGADGTSLTYDFDSNEWSPNDPITHEGAAKIFALQGGVYWVHDGERFVRFAAGYKEGSDGPRDVVGSESFFDPNATRAVAISPDFLAFQHGDDLVVVSGDQGALSAWRVPVPKRLDTGETAILAAGGRLAEGAGYWFLARSRILILKKGQAASAALSETEEEEAPQSALPEMTWYETGYRANLDTMIRAMDIPMILTSSGALQIAGKGLAYAEGQAYIVEADALATKNAIGGDDGKDPASDNPAPATGFAGIAPLAMKYCYRCHLWAESESGWKERKALITESLTSESMPPSGFDQPSAKERQALLDWLAEEP